MKKENQISKIFSVIQKYFDGTNITEYNLVSLINEIYFLIVEDSRIKIILSKNKLTTQDYEDCADTIIDLSGIIISSILKCYALDVTFMPYELSHEKEHKLKKHFSKILFSKTKNNIGSEIFSWLFVFSHLPSINNAIKNRKLVLAQKKKSKIKSK